MKIAVTTILILLVSNSPIWAGQFRHGLGRGDSLKANMPGLPQVRIGRTNLAIDVKDASPVAQATAFAAPFTPGTEQNTPPADPAVPASQIQAALDRLFSENFTIVQGNGEAVMRVAITHYQPAESRIATVMQKMRVPAPPNPDGTPQLDPNTGQQRMNDVQVPVEQWTAKGSIAARVEVVDSSGVLLDGFAPQASVRGTQVVSVNGQDRVDRTQIPNHEQVRAKLVTDLVAQFAPRYAPKPTEIEIPLAVDEELRAGNKLAKEGDFANAAKSWQTATLKKPEEGEGDRIHNLGAVHEVEAYVRLMKQSDPSTVEPYFERAAQQYLEAAAKDPKEKYFTRAAERVRKAKLMLGAWKEAEAKRQGLLAAKAAPSSWPPGPGGIAAQSAFSPQTTFSPQAAAPPQWLPQTGQPVQTADPNLPASSGQALVSPAPTVAAPVNPLPVTQTPIAQAPVAAAPVNFFAPQAPAASVPAPAAPVNVIAPQAPAAAPAPLDAVTQEALEAALNDPRPDTPQETTFRQFAGLRIRSAASPATEELKQQLESMGPLAYGLKALASKRVVFQEARDWAAMQPKIAAYRDSFSAFAQDGKIVPEERAVLRTLATNLGLSDSDMKSIESAFTVKE